jgi:DNA-binding NarL/FixJ family response regulator
VKLPAQRTPELIRVLVADSNQTQSQIMCGALRRHPGLRVTCCRAELSGCLDQLEVTPAGVVLIAGGVLDADHDYEILRGLRSAYPRTGLILLTNEYDRDLVVNAMRYGARGIFCSADQPFKALCHCIEAVHQGQIWANNEQIQYLVDALADAATRRIVNAKGEGVLTPREDLVVGLVATGISNREIAEQLSIKENTVKKSLLRIYDKLGVSNRVELVLYALTHRDRYKSEAAPRQTATRAVVHSVSSDSTGFGGILAEGALKTN